MFEKGQHQISEKYRYMAASVSMGMAFGVIVAMLAGAEGLHLPIGIGGGIVVGAAVGRFLIWRGSGE